MIETFVIGLGLGAIVGLTLARGSREHMEAESVSSWIDGYNFGKRQRVSKGLMDG